MGYYFRFKIVDNPTEAVEIMSGVLAQNLTEVAFDTETTGLDHMKCEVHSFSLATADMSWSFTNGAMRAIVPQLNELFSTADFVAHNAVFDLHFAKKLGIVPTGRVIDTLVASWLCDENRSNALKNLAKTRLGIVEELPDFKEMQHEAKKRLGKKRLDEVTIWDFNQEELGEYAARDTRLTYDLWQVLKEDLIEEGQADNFFNYKCDFIKIIYEMEDAGMLVDQNQLNRLTDEFSTIYDNAKTEILNNKVVQKMFPKGDFNINSTQQLGKLLFTSKKAGGLGIRPTLFTKKTKKPKTDKIALNRALHADKSGLVKHIVAHNQYTTLLNSFLKKIKATTAT